MNKKKGTTKEKRRNRLGVGKKENNKTKGRNIKSEQTQEMKLKKERTERKTGRLKVTLMRCAGK